MLGTSSAAAVMDDMGVAATFNVALHVPALKEPDIRAVLVHLAAFHPAEVRYMGFFDPRYRFSLVPLSVSHLSSGPSHTWSFACMPEEACSRHACR